VPGEIETHIVVDDGGVSTAQWGPFVLKSAFQPIFAFADGKLAVVGFEALLRPDRGGDPIAPLAFFADLPAADRLFVENLSLTVHLMNAAHLPAEAEIFINLDPSVFSDLPVAERSIRRMRLTLAETGIDPHRVVCEITEKKALSQDVLFSLVAQIRASGFRVAVDDYGADDSDMARIRALHPDVVKFDADWINRLIGSGPGFALLATMVSMFAEQGIRTVFEGIENSWQIELAEKSGVSMLQGFALARPELAPANFVRAGAPGNDPPTAPPDRPRATDTRPSKTFGKRVRPR
jgi:EAL domain-containing protein (putative c-di-GMP-specific phosphodiesterase class I)